MPAEIWLSAVAAFKQLRPSPPPSERDGPRIANPWWPWDERFEPDPPAGGGRAIMTLDAMRRHVAVRGSVGSADCAKLARVLRLLTDVNRGDSVVDLSAAESVDVAAAHCLTYFGQCLASVGARLTTVGAPSELRRALDLVRPDAVPSLVWASGIDRGRGQ